MAFKKSIVTLILIFPSFLVTAQNGHFSQNSFSEAKIYAAKINAEAPGSFYCGCHITWEGKHGVPDLNSCGYKVRKNEQRAHRIEWEHVMPAWQFGHLLSCWQQGGRKACAKDPRFRHIESDLHNLQPAIGEVNGDRGNAMFSHWESNSTQYENCGMKIDMRSNRADPPVRTRGTIARTYLYMRDRYRIKLPARQVRLFDAWNRRYPPDAWECKRNQLITQVQGNSNTWIERACQ